MKMLPINCSPLFLFPASFLSTLLPAKKDIAGRRAELSEGRSFNSFASEKKKIAVGVTLVYNRGFGVVQMGKAYLMQTGMAEANLKAGQGRSINVHIQYRSNNSWTN